MVFSELVGIAGDLDSGIPNLFKFTLRQQNGYQKIQVIAFQNEHENAKNVIVENGLSKLLAHFLFLTNLINMHLFSQFT